MILRGNLRIAAPQWYLIYSNSMIELVKIIWVANFFLFALALLFVWSKVTIIVKRLTTLEALLTSVRTLRAGNPNTF